MFSLMTTVESIRHVAELQASSITLYQYVLCVEVTLGLDEHYLIPSLIWPPPAFFQLKTSSLTTCEEACHD